MINTKLWQLYQTLSKKEIRQVKKVLKSSIYNQEEAVQRLFDWMDKPKKTGTRHISSEKAFAFVYPNKIYDKFSFHALIARLLNIIERFLKSELLQSNPVEGGLKKVQIYRQKKLAKHFNQSIKETRKLLENQTQRNSSFYFYQCQLEVEAFEMKGRDIRSRETNLQELTDSLNLFFIAEKLRWAVIIESHQTVYKSEYKQPFLPLILELVANSEWLDIPSIAVYYFSYKALTEPEEEEHFNALKRLIYEQGHVFPSVELREVYTIAINYGVKKMNTGKTAYIKKVFNLYRSGLSQGIFLKDGILSRWSYTNIVTIGLKLEEFIWIRQFIEDFKKVLESSFQNSMYAYNLARCYYYQHQYKESMILLLQVKLDDVLLNISAKVLLLKMYYELKEMEALDSLLGSFSIYLRRNKVIGYHKTNYSNIAHLIKKMMNVNSYDKAKIQQLKKEIQETKILTEQKWMLEQLEMLLVD